MNGCVRVVGRFRLVNCNIDIIFWLPFAFVGLYCSIIEMDRGIVSFMNYTMVARR